MKPAEASRRRIAAAATFVACLLVAGPAAYAAGAATADREDRPSVVAGRSEQNPLPSDEHHHSTSDQDTTEPDPPPTGDGPPAGSGTDGAGQQDPGTSGADRTQEPTDREERDQRRSGPADAGTDGADRPAATKVIDILASDCSGSHLAPHDGFQKAPRCVSTAFGEVASADRSPSLLITDAPRQVRPDQGFSLKVSTRNLVRDRFLPAAQGGYYAESSLLNGQGLQRGHFHTACRILPDPSSAPDSSPSPLFFKATEDGAGGGAPDEVTVDVPPVGQTGQLQCSSWAGDGSHRVPMMQRADQTPAFDSVRIKVG